jgi:hypothetical protein
MTVASAFFGIMAAPAAVTTAHLSDCTYWAGRLGANIQIALRETPTSNRVGYSLACRLG